MERKNALILSLLITLVIATNVFLFSHITGSAVNGRETAVIARVIDGDTLETSDNRTIRLININTPERKEYGYEEAKNFLKSYENKTIELEIVGIDKYKRYLGRIYSDGDYLNLEIVKNGFANKYLVREDELKEFKKAEEEAIAKELGIWNKSDNYGCIKAEIDSKDEVVKIINSCSAININGWKLKDESRKIYEFGNVALGDNKIKLHTGLGVDNETDIFWQFESEIWNNDRDSLYIRDNENKLAFYESYGY